LPEKVIERELVERSQRGDKRAFEALVKRYWKRAYFSALAFVGSPEDAMDLSQDAFVMAYRAISRFDPEKSFFPWLYTILRNHCFNFRRRKRGLSTTSIEQMLENGIELRSDSPQPDAVLHSREMGRAVLEALYSLDEPHREIIFLREFRGLSYEEISKLLGCPRGTVMSRLYYARKALRAKLNGMI